MRTPCEIVRDLLPLYADEVCSAESRALVEEHLSECPGCGEYLKQLRAGEMETELKQEKDTVIRRQAKRFKRRSEAAGVIVGGIFMIPILVFLIVNIASGRGMGWFFIVAAALVTAASLSVVPLMVPEDKLFWTFCAFTVSLMALLGTCCLYTHGTWFRAAASASLFGLAVVFLPFVIRAKPLEKLVAGRNKAVLVIALDVILFANMMNMITINSKSVVHTLLLAAVCAAGVCFLAADGFIRKGGDGE